MNKTKPMFLRDSLSSCDKSNSRTQTTKQSKKKKKKQKTQYQQVKQHWLKSAFILSMAPNHFILRLLLANGLPPSFSAQNAVLGGERRFLSRSFMHSLFCAPAWPTLLKCLRFCSTALLAAGANKRIQRQHFLFLIWQTRSGTSLNNSVPIAVKHKETRRERFSRKAGG